jgi:hypothetical protein
MSGSFIKGMNAKCVRTLVLAVLWSGGAPAHHSFTATYDEDGKQKIEGHRLRLLSIERPSDGWTWKGFFE